MQFRDSTATPRNATTSRAERLRAVVLAALVPAVAVALAAAARQGTPALAPTREPAPVAESLPAPAPAPAGQPATGGAHPIAPGSGAIAITLDDLPFVSVLGPGDSRQAATVRILEALKKHQVPATGFVVCDREGEPLLRQWLDAGMQLGNHSNSHPHLDAVALDDWEEEVCACGRRLSEITGAPVRWFRYPFLQMGRTIGRRDSALAIVRGCGHDIAHVSVDTGEWVLVKPYGAALARGDSALARSIGQAYVDHLLAAVDHYREIARARVGREVAQVVLLHANALAADHLDPFLTRLEERGWRFVPLGAALADPVYALPDEYAGPIGLSWLYRFAPVMDSAWAWDDEQVRMMSARFPAP